MQNILSKIIKFLYITATTGFIGFAGFLLGQDVHTAETDQILDLLVEESQTVSSFELEVVKLAEAIYGEAKGHTDDWPHIASAIFNRVDDERWADTVMGVLFSRCEIDALCDSLPEVLTSEVGQQALQFATQSLLGYENDTFVPTHSGHSWATPAAADGHAYFEGLQQVLEASGHQYFADKPLAPTVSLRPQARPVAQLKHDVMLALLEASQ
jgi:hypothetical protein